MKNNNLNINKTENLSLFAKIFTKLVARIIVGSTVNVLSCGNEEVVESTMKSFFNQIKNEE